jgi:hypothetical protein
MVSEKPPLPSQTCSTLPAQVMVPAAHGGPASLPPVAPLLLDDVATPPVPPLPLLDDALLLLELLDELVAPP